MSARAICCMLLASACTAFSLAPAAAQAAPASPPAAAEAPASAPDTAPNATPAPAAAQTAAVPAGGAPAAAATAAPTGAFGAFSKNSNQPIDIESDTLVVHDREQYATFLGNVKAVQGTTTLRSKELKVHYVGGAANSLTGAGPKAAAAPAPPAAPGATPPAAGEQAASATPKPAGAGGLGDAGNQISKIEARGDVVITTDQDQTTTSDWALYDVPAQLVTVGGNVVLTQGKNVLKGDRLVIDLKTGESRFENTGNGSTGGKIRALFMPKQDAAAKTGKAGDGQTNKDKAPSEPAAQDAADDGQPAPQEATGEGASAEQEAPTPLFPGLPH
jgi:lipopolysaccharide export system protein LptA